MPVPTHALTFPDNRGSGFAAIVVPVMNRHDAMLPRSREEQACAPPANAELTQIKAPPGAVNRY
jgi:hypothetical protein